MNVFLFSGCISKLVVNDRMVDFSHGTATQYKVIPGCPRRQKADPCEGHMCRNGKCRPINDVEYKCDCMQGFSGPMCDIGKSAHVKILIGSGPPARPYHIDLC